MIFLEIYHCSLGDGALLVYHFFHGKSLLYLCMNGEDLIFDYCTNTAIQCKN